MKMPFGRWKGKPLSELPDDYLDWLASPETKLNESLRSAVVAEALAREGKLFEPAPDELTEVGAELEPPPIRSRDFRPATSVQAADPTLVAALLDLKDAVVTQTRVSADLERAMARLNASIDRIERAHFELRPTGEHWTDHVPPTEAGSKLEPGEPF